MYQIHIFITLVQKINKERERAVSESLCILKQFKIKFVMKFKKCVFVLHEGDYCLISR
jgi:hypothetical protein